MDSAWLPPVPTDDLCVNAALIRCGCGRDALHWGDRSSVRSLTTLHPTVGRIHSLHGTTGLQMFPFSTLNLILLLSYEASPSRSCFTHCFGSTSDSNIPPQKNLLSVTDCIKTDYVASDQIILFTVPIVFPKLHTVRFVNKAHDIQIQVPWPKNIYASY